MSKIKVIGLILAYNAEKTLEDLYNRIPRNILDGLILVDDESQDNTLIIAKKIGIESFTHRHFGYGGNLKYGLAKALELGAEYIVELHADNQYDPAAIFQVFKNIKKSPALISGSRFTSESTPIKDGMPIIKYIANRFLSWLDRKILGVDLSEFHSGFRIYSRKLLATIPYRENANDNLFTFQLIAQTIFYKLTIEEIPVQCQYTKYSSSLGRWRSIKYAVQSIMILFCFWLAKNGFKKKFRLIKF